MMMVRIVYLSALLAVVAADSEPLTLLEKEKLAELNNGDEDDRPPGVSVRVVGGDQVTSKSKYPFLVEWEGELFMKRNLVLDLDSMFLTTFHVVCACTILFIAPRRCQMWRLHDS